MASTAANINVGAIQIGPIEAQAGLSTAKAIADIETAGSAQTDAVQAEGAAQVASVQEAGATVLASIPADYTALADAFAALGLHADTDGTLYQE